MQLFVVVLGAPGAAARAAGVLLEVAADGFPELDPATAWQAGDPRRAVSVAGVQPPAALTGGRRHHVADGSHAVLYDGLPVDAHGSLDATDAAVAGARWEELRAGRLEGQFAAVRADLREGAVEVLTDALGLVPVVRAALPGGGWVVSNSVEVARRVAGCDAPDPLGAATMLTLGWPAGGRTVRAEVEVLAGGRVHRWRRGDWQERDVRLG